MKVHCKTSVSYVRLVMGFRYSDVDHIIFSSSHPVAHTGDGGAVCVSRGTGTPTLNNIDKVRSSGLTYANRDRPLSKEHYTAFAIPQRSTSSLRVPSRINWTWLHKRIY